MINIKPAGYLNKFTGNIWNSEQQPGADSEPEIYEPLVRLSDVHGLVAENAAINDRLQKLIQIVNNADNSYCMCGDSMKSHAGGGCGSPTGMFDYHYNAWLESEKETPATNAAIAEINRPIFEAMADLAGSMLNDAINVKGKEAKAFTTCADRTAKLSANLRAGRKG